MISSRQEYEARKWKGIGKTTGQKGRKKERKRGWRKGISSSMKVLQLHVGACKFTCAPAAWGCCCLCLIYNLILLTLPLPLLMPLLQSPCRQHEKQRKCLTAPTPHPPPLASIPIMRAVSWDTDWKVCPWEFTEIFAGFRSSSNAEESIEYQNSSWETKTKQSINNWHRRACMI